MALEEYRRKRDFRATAEPEGGARPAADAGRFVVQKHAASHLHYDFRLELEGVLKSWAVPRGPSLDPSVKRLAVHVEDHPIEYGGFEGIIPRGQYGGGTVMLWDRGRWIPEGDAKAALRKGHLRFRLEGERLRGGWHLVRSRRGEGREKEQWLLFKDDDGEARSETAGVVTEDAATSVATGRTMKEIAAHADAEWRSGAPAEEALVRKKPAPSPTLKLDGARKAAFPAMTPQLATLVDEAPAGDDWIHEIKYDGYRVLALVRGGKARLVTRRGNDWTARFSAVAEALAGLADTAVVDGEVVVLTANGASSFQALQNALGGGGGEPLFQAFDLPYLDGMDLRGVPLLERKKALRALLARGDGRTVRYSDHVAGRGAAFHAQACRMGLEGIISKRADARYQSKRTRDWVKVKCLLRQELVIGGWTEPKGSRSRFGALLLGVHDEEGALVYAGKVGTGFDEARLKAVHARLAKLERADSPFANHGRRGKRPAGVHWVEPELVCEIAFTEWTDEGILRHPVFHGLREDKDAADVVRERPAHLAPSGKSTAPPEKPAPSPAPSARKGGGAEVAGVRLTSPGKVLFPVQGITKLEMARYYEEIAEWMLPHAADRPLTLVRCPDGVTGECFYQKHGDRHFGAAVGRVAIAENDGEERVYTYVDSAAGLVSMVQMGAVELHTSNARRDRYERPDRFVIDLDPGPGVPWARTVEAAFEVRALLEEVGLDSWVKTTGGKGLHVLVPLRRRHEWDDVKDFTRALAVELSRRHPGRYVTKSTLSARKGKIYLDYLRNGRGATSISAFCIRAKPSAAISVPLGWDELTPELDPDSFLPSAVRRRLARLESDPWEGYWASSQSITRSVRDALAVG